MSTVDDEVASAMSALIELDAKEFGTYVQQGGWRLGLLVARSVEPGLNPSPGRNQYNSEEVPRVREAPNGKVSQSEFARMALGTEGATTRVRRYYDAWELAASKGIVPHAAELAPGDEIGGDWDKMPPWSGYFGATALRGHTGGATGKLNLTVKLGHFGDRLLRSHKRLTTFFLKDVAEEKRQPGKQVQELAGRYAACLETQATLLRKVETGEPLPEPDELKQLLDPNRYFNTAR